MKKILFAVAAALLMLAPLHSADAAGVKERIVEVTGTGPTRDKAINDGLAQAVGQVCGVQLQSEDVARIRLEMNSSESGEEGNSTSETSVTLGQDSERQTNTKVRGNIKSYTILSEGASELVKGDIEVRLQVVVSYYENSAQTNRKRIAVLPFRVLERNDAQMLFTVELNQSLTNYLTETRNFAVLDRQYLDEKHSEFDLLQGDDVRVEERARVGNTLGTDFILVGSITAFTADAVQEKVPYTDEVRVSVRGRVSLGWRLIEAATGQIAASGTHSEKFRKTINAAEDLDWIAELANPAGVKIARKITDTIYPIVVMAYEPGDPAMLTLARGGDSLKEGTKFFLIRYGEGMIDPYTGEALAREEKRVGKVVIEEVGPKISHARILSCNVDLTGLQPKQYIVRPVKEEADSGKPKPKPTMQPQW